jgi:ribosomal protein S18 acetylase RimI-like enzyme
VIRPLVPSDAPALEVILKQHADSSMFLRSNARAAGLEYRGNPLEADYVAEFDGERITAVAAHCWNGILLVQAPVRVDDVVRAAVRHSGRPVAGLSGPADQVRAARSALSLDDRPAPKFGQEELFALQLADLSVPTPLADGRWICRKPHEDELELLTDWRVGFFLEALHGTDGPAVRDACREEVRLIHQHESDWLLTDAGRPVSYSNFNARLPDIVQIGGVWTPPELRGRGYGGAVVAGSLVHARREGVVRAVLFAEHEAAKRAYRRIGFRKVGEYALVLFR